MTEVGRIRVVDNTFHVERGGKVTIMEDIEVVIVHAAPQSRVYYSDKYDSLSVARRPVCWSDDSRKPAELVPEAQKQSTRCIECTQNVQGSGDNHTRACRFTQRLAVAFPGAIDVIYRLQVSGNSIFGRGDRGLGLQEYARQIVSRGTRVSEITTHISIDKMNEYLQLTFKPKAYLSRENSLVVEDMQDNPSTLLAVSSKSLHNTGDSPFGKA